MPIGSRARRDSESGLHIHGAFHEVGEQRAAAARAHGAVAAIRYPAGHVIVGGGEDARRSRPSSVCDGLPVPTGRCDEAMDGGSVRDDLHRIRHLLKAALVRRTIRARHRPLRTHAGRKNGEQADDERSTKCPPRSFGRSDVVATMSETRSSPSTTGRSAKRGHSWPLALILGGQ
jgi:hypothetical protein